MKVGGVIRTIDKLGRVVIPKSMCKALNIQAEDELDITWRVSASSSRNTRTGAYSVTVPKGL